MEKVLLMEETSGLFLSSQKDSSDWNCIALVQTKMWLICIFLIVLYFSWGTSEQWWPTHTHKSHIGLYKCMCSWLASWSNVGVRWRRLVEARQSHCSWCRGPPANRLRVTGSRPWCFYRHALGRSASGCSSHSLILSKTGVVSFLWSWFIGSYSRKTPWCFPQERTAIQFNFSPSFWC